MLEQRDPFLGGALVGGRAGQELVIAVELDPQCASIYRKGCLLP